MLSQSFLNDILDIVNRLKKKKYIYIYIKAEGIPALRKFEFEF